MYRLLAALLVVSVIVALSAAFSPYPPCRQCQDATEAQCQGRGLQKKENDCCMTCKNAETERCGEVFGACAPNLECKMETGVRYGEREQRVKTCQMKEPSQ